MSATMTQPEVKVETPPPAPKKEFLSLNQRACKKAELGQHVWWYEGADVRPSNRRGATIIGIADSTVELLIYEPGPGKGFYPGGGVKRGVKNAADKTLANFEKQQVGCWDFTDRQKLLFEKFPTPYCGG